MRAHHPLLWVALMGVPMRATTQTPAQPNHVLRGSVMSASGAPLSSASVFLLETTDAATTDSGGRFTLRTAAAGRVTVTARKIGFTPASIEAPVDTAPLVFRLVRQSVKLAPITVQAGSYTAGSGSNVTLTTLQVMKIPGGNADIARAVQTLPGVQAVDEGTGVFVHGGDVSETRVLLNGAAMLSPYNYETPTGSSTATVNPFLVDGTNFLAGGFGARYGNILSGVVDLQTAGRPTQNTETGTVSLAGISTSVNLALGQAVGARMTAGRNDTRYIFKLNGSTRDYAPAPNGEDYSGSLIYDYRPTGQLKWFTIHQQRAMGVSVDEASFRGEYATEGHNTMSTLNWGDVFGHISTSVIGSYASANHDESFGAFTLGTTESWGQTIAQTTWSPDDRYALRVGTDADWRSSRYIGSLPVSAANRAPGARTTLFDSPVVGTRTGVFGEWDWRPFDAVRVVPGVRSDYSTLTGVRTVDPRLSITYKGRHSTYTAAVGDYHQIPDPLYLGDGIGVPHTPPQEARQAIVGAEWGEGINSLRVELYDKEYRNLVGLKRTAKVAVSGGTGQAHGADVMFRHRVTATTYVRATYNFVNSRRTDPETRLMARAPFDITHSLFAVVDQTFGKGWSITGAFRYSTGKAFTPVVGATRDTGQQIWLPVYGLPNAERLPPLSRIDLSATHLSMLPYHVQFVTFLGLQNLVDRVNVYQYSYSPDYSVRVPVRSNFKRGIFFGGSFTHLGN